MQHPDEGMIHTWLDGELSQEEATALEAHIAKCDQCKAAVAEARGFIAASSRIVGALDNVPGGVIPVAKPAKRSWYSSPQFRAAAAVLIVAGASFLVMKPVMQKSTLAVYSGTEANEASTTQRVMSVQSSSAATAPASVEHPVLADPAVKKTETPKPTQPPAKGFAVLGAPVRMRDSAPISLPAAKIANESDFSGKGVKGGSAAGVEGAAPVGRVAGVAVSAADALSSQPGGFAAVQPELKVIRVDSSTSIRRTTYQLSPGREVVLTEQPATGLSEVGVTDALSQSRKVTAQSTPTAANAPVAPTRAAQAPAIQSESTVYTISWTDPSTRRRYTLSGPVSAEELESIKARLIKSKQ